MKQRATKREKVLLTLWNGIGCSVWRCWCYRLMALAVDYEFPIWVMHKMTPSAKVSTVFHTAAHCVTGYLSSCQHSHTSNKISPSCSLRNTIYSFSARTSSNRVSVESATSAVWYHMTFGRDESAPAALIGGPVERLMRTKIFSVVEIFAGTC